MTGNKTTDSSSTLDRPSSILKFNSIFVEVFRLSIVIVSMALGMRIPNIEGVPTALVLILFACIGYVLGGFFGRLVTSKAFIFDRTISRIPPVQLLTGASGMVFGGMFSIMLTIPVLVVRSGVISLALSYVVIVFFTYMGWRLGAERADDLMRYVGAGGRRIKNTAMDMNKDHTISFKLVDTSVLIDGRIVELCAYSFLEGDLVVPEFVLAELQALSDSSNHIKRARGQRGLDVLGELQKLNTIGVIVTKDDPEGVEGVDNKLMLLAEKTGMPILTTDSNLARVGEIRSLQMRNINRLADSVRPPVTAGDRITINVTKEGREPHQGVGFLPDGTMVVVDHAKDVIGETVDVEVTALTSTANGRLLFATLLEDSLL